MNIETAPKTAIGYVTEWQQPPDELQVKRNENAHRNESTEEKKLLPKSVLEALSGKPIQIYPGL